jgi:hypothetical protein
VRVQVGNVDGTFVGTSVVCVQVGNVDGAFVVRVQVGNVDGAFVVRVQVGNADDVFVGTSVVGALLGALLGAFVGDLVGARVEGLLTNFKITGGFSSSEHWLALKASASETKIPDDPTIKRAKMATEQNMIVTVYLVSRNKRVRVYYLGL